MNKPQQNLSIREINPATRKQLPQLIQLWEKSVRASHHFLTDKDISRYRELIINEYFDQLDLFCLTVNQQILGFMGTKNQFLQMLFIDPDVFGNGHGKALVNFAIHNCHINSVDVNEQNHKAIGFYTNLGFYVTERFANDAAGKHYPVLTMQLDHVFSNTSELNRCSVI